MQWRCCLSKGYVTTKLASQPGQYELLYGRFNADGYSVLKQEDRSDGPLLNGERILFVYSNSGIISIIIDLPITIRGYHLNNYIFPKTKT